MRILAGLPKRFLAQQYWDDYLVILYSSGYELVVLDHAKPIQNLPIANVCSASLNPKTGTLLAVTPEKLIIFEAVTSFNKPPRWCIVRELNYPEISSVAWLDKARFAFSCKSDIFIFSDTGNELSHSKVPHSSLLLSDFSGMLFIYDCHTNLPILSKDDVFAYLPHPGKISWCQFYQGFLFTLVGGWLRIWEGWQLRAACPAVSPPYLLEDGEVIVDGKKYVLAAQQLVPRQNNPSIPSGIVAANCGDGKYVVLNDNSLQLFQQTPTTDFCMVGESTGSYGLVEHIITLDDGILCVTKEEKILWDHHMHHRLHIYQELPEIKAVDSSRTLRWKDGELRLNEKTLDKISDKPEILDLKSDYAISVGGGLAKVFKIKDTPELEIVFEADSAALCHDLLAIATNGETTFYALEKWIPLRKVRGTAPAFCHDGYSVLAQGYIIVILEPEISENDDYNDTLAYDAIRNWNLPYCKTIFDVSRFLRHELPLYSPKVLSQLIQGDRIDVVRDILGSLLEELRFSVVDEKTKQANITLKMPMKNYNYNASELVDRLEKSHLPYLTAEMQQQLIHIASTVEGQEEDLDFYSICFLTLHDTEEPKADNWAYHSRVKPALLASLNLKPTWESYASVGAGWWLELETLAETFEQIGKNIFARQRDPVKCSLWYLALKKKSILQGLWRISHGHPEQQKTIKLLSHDYSTPRWRTAAMKNAYALMSLHRYEYAASLFLLGDSPVDACQTIARGCNDLQLAVAVARLYNSNKALNMLATRYFDDNLWFKSWELWETGSELEACKRLVTDPCGLLLYKQIRHLPTAIVPDEREAVEKMRTCFSLPFVAEKVIENWNYQKPGDTIKGSNTQKPSDSDMPETPAGNGFKPPPTNLQLEPDMSAFDFGF